MENNGTMLYRSPGANLAYGDHTYDCIGAETQADVERLLKEGWSVSMQEAIDKADAALPGDNEQLSPEERAKAAKQALAAAAELAAVEAKVKAVGAVHAAVAAKVRDAQAAQRASASRAVAAARVLSEAADAVLAADKRQDTVDAAKQALAHAGGKKKGSK